MKRRNTWIPLIVAMALSTTSLFAQWSNTGNNTTTGTLGIGAPAPSTGKVDINVGTSSVIYPALNVYRNGDPNLGIRVMTGSADGGTYTAWNGGLGSWYGIGFHCTQDGVTRGVFNARDGSFYMKGSLNTEGNAVVRGNLEFSDNPALNLISGSVFSGAIQIRSNGSVGGYDSRYLRLGMRDNNNVFYPVISVTDQMNTGIGTTNPDSKLTVKGRVHAEEVKVDLAVPGPDYVFEADYKLSSLEDLEKYLQRNKHLPEVPSATEMQKEGIELGVMNMVLLKKIEELTLHVIELNKRLEEMEKSSK